MAGEMAQDEALSNTERAYEVNVHNIILDTATEAISRRFLTHGTLLADLAWLDPRNFAQIRTRLPINALENLSKCLLKFDSRAKLLQDSGTCLRHHMWMRTRTVEDGSAAQEEERNIVTTSCSSCRNCPLCCYQVLRRFNMLADTYHLLGLAYTYLSLTQVACERTFSTLKFIKNRLRSSQSANKLEMFMMMATE